MNKHLCIRTSIVIILAANVFILAYLPSLRADEDKQKTTAPKQVGGLLFDMDEGVEVEKGPGGSVYVKSNREFMQNKFRETDEKLSELDGRLKKIEDVLTKIAPAEMHGKAEKKSGDTSTDNRKVLST